HLGNLSPEDLRKDDLYKRAKAADDAWPILRDFAYRNHRGADGIRWSYYRDLGNIRLLMMDSRGGRVLEEDRRSMVDADEWAWIEDKATGGFDHLILGTSLPLLLGPAMHHIQSWDERLCSGAWGGGAARWGEGLRRSQDLDHWASFHDSFAAMADLLARVATGEKGDAPSTVLILSGDVHHGYLAEATLAESAKSRVYQAVCSPLRNALPRKKSFLQNNAWTKPVVFTARLLARLAGVPAEPLNWRMTHDAAFFDNQVATLELDDGHAKITFEKAVLDASKEPALEKLYERRLV
ncbi:MAG TPA: alkaline phosphatase family protein, partial [Rubrobacter sp.]|nr:alkaline phosphatase family protein [Rubrobacter sp.]